MDPGTAAGPAAGRRAGLPRHPVLTSSGEYADFLAHQPPFDAVDQAEREAAAAAAKLLPLPRGTPALVEDGDPATGLFVVRSGSMELSHGAQVVDVLEPGECFGHPSLLSGMAPAFSVIAREDSTVLLIPPEPALRVLRHPAAASYIASSLRERLVRAGHTADALPDLSTTRVDALVDRDPLLIDPETPIGEAARRMTDERRHAALVGDLESPALLTDADLRERVVAAGASFDDPVRSVAQTDPPAVAGDLTVAEALGEALESGSRDLLAKDSSGRVIGVLGVEQLAAGENPPLALRQELARAPDLDTLVSVATDGLQRLVGSQLAAGLGPVDVCRALAAQSDAVTMRLLDFAFARHGQAPAAWAWMALGSVARRELTLSSDQDNAFAYSDDAEPGADEYFARVTADVNDGLARCGFGADNAEVLARNPDWRMSAGQWRQEFQDCLEHPDRSHLVRAAVSFDFRHVGGGLDIVSSLIETMRSAAEYPDFLGRLARTVTDWPVPLGRRGKFSTNDEGRIDVKKGGALPIANLARYHAISNGITVSGTLDRLVAAEESGHLDPAGATTLREAFKVVTRVRLEHHASCMREGREPDNFVDPEELPLLLRVTLREALHEVAAQQKKMSVYAPMRI